LAQNLLNQVTVLQDPPTADLVNRPRTAVNLAAVTEVAVNLAAATEVAANPVVVLAVLPQLSQFITARVHRLRAGRFHAVSRHGRWLASWSKRCVSVNRPQLGGLWNKLLMRRIRSHRKAFLLL